MENISEDIFLGGHLLLRQPIRGYYRAGLDAVLLGSLGPFPPGSKILDVGCGVGTVMLCSSVHNPLCSYTGLELQPSLFCLAQENISLNNRGSQCQVFQGSITDPSPALKETPFHVVLTNPPFFHSYGSTPSPNASKNLCHVGDVSLKVWIEFCIKRLKSRGLFLMIYPTALLDQVLGLLFPLLGEIQIYPLWPRAHTPAKRFILKGRKGLKTGLTLTPGVVVHEAQGNYTPLVNAVLRGERCLDVVRSGKKW